MNKQERLAHLLAFLPEGKEASKGKTSAEVQRYLEEVALSQGVQFHFDKRKFQRDMEELEALRHDDADRVRRYALPLGSKNQQLEQMESEQAFIYTFAYRQLGPFLPEQIRNRMERHFAAAMKRLQRSDAACMAALQQRLLIATTDPLQAPVIDSDLLGRVNDALFRQHQIEIVYRAASHGHQEKIYRLHPICLAQTGQSFSLFAVKHEEICHRTEAPVQEFKLARMVAAKELRDPVCAGLPSPKEVSDKKLHEYFSRDEIRLRLRFADSDSGRQLCNSLRETPFSDDQEIRERDGRTELIATVRETLALKWLLQRLAHRAEVLEPTSLREEIVGFIRGAQALYGTPI